MSARAPLNRSATSNEKRNDGEHEECEKENLGYTCRCGGDSEKSEDARNECNDEKHGCPIQHDVLHGVGAMGDTKCNRCAAVFSRKEGHFAHSVDASHHKAA